MSILSLVLFLLLLSVAIAFQGPGPEDPDTAAEPGSAQEQPGVSDAENNDGGNAVYGPRLVVTSVLGFLGAVVAVTTAFFIYRKARGKPLDIAKIARRFGRSREGRSQGIGEGEEEVENVAQPPPVAMEEGTV